MASFNSKLASVKTTLYSSNVETIVYSLCHQRVSFGTNTSLTALQHYISDNLHDHCPYRSCPSILLAKPT